MHDALVTDAVCGVWCVDYLLILHVDSNLCTCVLEKDKYLDSTLQRYMHTYIHTSIHT